MARVAYRAISAGMVASKTTPSKMSSARCLLRTPLIAVGCRPLLGHTSGPTLSACGARACSSSAKPASRGSQQAGPSQPPDAGQPSARRVVPEAGQEPEVKQMFALSGVGAWDLLTLPPRHLLWAATLRAVARHYPDAADQASIIAGAELAVGTVFELLAAREFGSLRGLVHEGLLKELTAGEAAVEQEGWLSPPELIHARVLGLLSAEGSEEEGGGMHQRRTLRVTPLVYSKERYTYQAESEVPTLVYGLRRWTFERDLDAGHHWVVVDMGSKHWYWQRVPS